MNKDEEIYLKLTWAISYLHVQSRNFTESEIPLVGNLRISKEDGA
jgi:hypothetical protein